MSSVFQDIAKKRERFEEELQKEVEDNLADLVDDLNDAAKATNRHVLDIIGVSEDVVKAWLIAKNPTAIPASKTSTKRKTTPVSDKDKTMMTKWRIENDGLEVLDPQGNTYTVSTGGRYPSWLLKDIKAGTLKKA